MTTIQNADSEVYQGQFGEFTITESDRQGVIIYRAGLMAAALSFALGTLLVLKFADYTFVPVALNVLYICFSIGLAVSLLTIHIYLAPLHRALQAFWLAGTVAAIAIALTHSEPLALAVYHQPTTILGIGFIFAALTGIFFKEAFCFNRLETKLLTPLVPLLLLGHLFGILSVPLEQVLLGLWAALFVVFALRKVVQPIPPDIGDKSVFVYLKQQAAVE
ncbi:DUF2301 domain-containing membrane protein [Leptolyngbya sp. FACHB-671]|uniref:DUF2301 domain-containing membrane protein n=1 Tax=unclassified Leptolyngbya TaxID=2650499 RepID=UPI001686CADE|nr:MULTISPECIES: DUF2301 domain-containing membrane protein [unclassified Leptolyngbya]MBD1996872.1 DUF2301 domain-containing membrane protein [Leptolyngbya sp. FACHB-541]MBD2067554.1 DUF2301 domain-containing membrane protein [Leptolyngbya sp. FACHB-671]